MDASDGRGEGLSVDIHSKGHQTNNIFRMKKTGRGGEEQVGDHLNDILMYWFVYTNFHYVSLPKSNQNRATNTNYYTIRKVHENEKFVLLWEGSTYKRQWLTNQRDRGN